MSRSCFLFVSLRNSLFGIEEGSESYDADMAVVLILFLQHVPCVGYLSRSIFAKFSQPYVKYEHRLFSLHVLCAQVLP